MSANPRYKRAKIVTIVNAATNTLLAVFKIAVGWVGHSHALVADGIHSFSDLITDALVLIAAKMGGKDPDQSHPYGHQRFETIGAIIIAIILLAVGGSIIYESAKHFLSLEPGPIPELSVLIVAAVSILANEWLFRYTLKAGQEIHSNLLVTNAWHNRTDAFVSTIVLISVLGTIIGFEYLDSIGAIIIAIFIIKAGVSNIWTSLRELTDTAVNPELVENIKKCILEVPGVLSVHQLRTRTTGGNIIADTHVMVDPFISVSEGHHIGEQVHMHLINKIKQISDVTVHIDPEDDERTRPSLHLPHREEIIAQLKEAWLFLPGADDIVKITLHYLDGRLYVEVFLPISAIPEDLSQVELAKEYRQSARHIPDVVSVAIHIVPLSKTGA